MSTPHYRPLGMSNADWQAAKQRRARNAQEVIQAARQIEPDNERLVEAGTREETESSLIEARRILSESSKGKS